MDKVKTPWPTFNQVTPLTSTTGRNSHKSKFGTHPSFTLLIFGLKSKVVIIFKTIKHEGHRSRGLKDLIGLIFCSKIGLYETFSYPTFTMTIITPGGPRWFHCIIAPLHHQVYRTRSAICRGYSRMSCPEDCARQPAGPTNQGWCGGLKNPNGTKPHVKFQVNPSFYCRSPLYIYLNFQVSSIVNSLDDCNLVSWSPIINPNGTHTTTAPEVTDPTFFRSIRIGRDCWIEIKKKKNDAF